MPRRRMAGNANYRGKLNAAGSALLDEILGTGNKYQSYREIDEVFPEKLTRDNADETLLALAPRTAVSIGDDNVIRENVTIHRGTVQDRSLTSIGDRNLIMAYAHVGHDSAVGNDTILVNNTALAGHVEVGDWAILSGYTLVHQFCKIGAHSFSGMGTSIGKDVPAFVTVAGSPAEAKTINAEGLRRRGFDASEISALRRAFKILYRQGLTLEVAMERLQSMVTETPSVQILIDSLQTSQRGIVR